MATMMVRAQQAPPATLVPMTAASLATQPDRYLGKVVAVYATVETLVSKTTFSLDQNPKGVGPVDILVIAPNLNIHPRPNEYITVVGEAMRFDAAANDWTAAKEAASTIQPMCAQCHNAFRERLEDGSYRVKPSR